MQIAERLEELERFLLFTLNETLPIDLAYYCFDDKRRLEGEGTLDLERWLALQDAASERREPIISCMCETTVLRD